VPKEGVQRFQVETGYRQFVGIRATHRLQFLWRIRHGWIELAQQTSHGVFGNFPDAEETEDVVDAVSIHIQGHVSETPLPPVVIVLSHACPVIRGEAPVLSGRRKAVRRGAHLYAGVEQFGLVPGFHAVAVYPDGYVTFKYDAFGVRMVPDLFELLVQEVLRESVPLNCVVPGLPSVTEFGYQAYAALFVCPPGRRIR